MKIYVSRLPAYAAVFPDLFLRAQGEQLHDTISDAPHGIYLKKNVYTGSLSTYTSHNEDCKSILAFVLVLN